VDAGQFLGDDVAVAVVPGHAATTELDRCRRSDDALLTCREYDVTIDRALPLSALDVADHLAVDERSDDGAEGLVVLCVQVSFHHVSFVG
jgi:hypothetical protein